MKKLVLFVLIAGLYAGCGYTQKNLLPENIQTIHVLPIKNMINLTGEVTEKQRFRVYRPGVEVELTNALINRFIMDGNLKVTPLDRADAVVEAKLTDYRRDPLRYSTGDDIQEYRLSVTVDVTVYERSSKKVLWRSNLTGDTSFFLSGSRAVTEDEAAQKAVEDTARRIVDYTVELWR